MLISNEVKKGRSLLSFDGGGIGVLSSLLILRELMHRIQHTLNLSELPRPCDCFDMIVGCGFGGLAAIMLGRLHMPVDEAIESFFSIMTTTFSEKIWKPGDSRTKHLEKAVATLARKHTKEENLRMIDTEDNGLGCKTFVCVAYGHNLEGIERLRTYSGAKNQAPNYTVEEALLATTAIRGLFEPRVLQESTGLSSVYIAADLVYGNPVSLMLEEAQDAFPDQHIACVISLGSGHPQVAGILNPDLNLVKNPGDLIEVLERMAKSCEKTAQDIRSRFREIDDFYFRFNVDQGMQPIRESDYQQAPAIQAHTRTFISSITVNDATGLDSAVQAIIARNETVATSHLTGTVHALPGWARIQPCPPPSPNFTGREDAIQILLKYFTTPSRIQRSFVLYGLGGSGKTQIARMFVEQYRDCFSGVYYIDATSAQTIELGLKNIARAKHAGRTIYDTLTWFKGHVTNWVIYYDNIDDTQLDLRRYFPDCSHGNLLITTRAKKLVAYSRDLGLGSEIKCDYAVSGMRPIDAESLLLRLSRRGTSECERNLASKIVKMLGFHALAVTQAGAYISALDYRLDEYFEQCLKTDSPLEKCALKNIPIDHDYPLGLYATWMLSYEKLSSETLQLLHYFAFMHHSGITEDIFRVAYNRIYHQGQIAESSLPSFLCQFEDSSAAGAWSSPAFRDATMEARNYCLIEYNRQAGVYSIHPLVHQWIQKLAPANVVKSVAGLLALCVCEQTKLDDFDFGRTLLPHIDALPEAQKVDQSSASQFSLIYREAGRWTDAQNLEETVLNHRRERLGEVHPETLNSMHNLGVIYRERGRWEQAEQMLKKAMELRKKLNENSAKAIDSANQLAWVYLEQRKWEPARILEEEVLQTKRYVKGENDAQTLESMGQLAWAYWGLNRFSDAQRLEEEVVEANKCSLTANHPRTLQSMHNLAATYKANGLLDKAELLAKEVLNSRSHLLGKHHPHTLVTMCTLGGVYTSQGRLSDAEGLLEEVVEFRSKVLCKNHPHTLSSMHHLATIYARQERWKEAEGLMTEVLDQQKALGLDAHFLLTHHNLALMYAHQNDWSKAVESMRKVVEGRKEKLGEKDPDTVASIECLKEWEAAIDTSRRNSPKSCYILLSVLVPVLACLFWLIMGHVS